MQTEKPKTKKQQAIDERAECIVTLRKMLKPGQTVYTTLNHVSRSGMFRRISLKIVRDGEIVDISWRAATAMGMKLHNAGGIGIGGCGMDMGFALVYDLGRTLWPKGFKLPKNKRGRNGDTSGHDNDGGYALRQSWI